MGKPDASSTRTSPNIVMPVNADIPDIHDDHSWRTTTGTPIRSGRRGLANCRWSGVAAAIANAVYHATGVRVRKLPIRIEDVLV